MKAWNSVPAFNAQCLRVIIVVVQVGAVNIHIYIYVAAVEALREKERQDET
jgi:NADH:ubiquinone oxidoreductase subunit 6 (subunit J)